MNNAGTVYEEAQGLEAREAERRQGWSGVSQGGTTIQPQPHENQDGLSVTTQVQIPSTHMKGWNL